MIVIPAVDVRAGRCVRLRMGRAEDETVYSDDPVEVAVRWDVAGADRIHVVDLDGAFEGVPRNISIIEAIIERVDCEVEVGGGLRAPESVARVLEAGAARAILGTVAAEEPEAFAGIVRAHPGRVNLGLDARDGKVATRGWTEVAGAAAIDFVRSFAGLPIGEVIYTDISRDGMLSGPNLEAVRLMAGECPFPLIASGGVGSLDDIRALADIGPWGAIVGKALYDGRVSVAEALAAGGH